MSLSKVISTAMGELKTTEYPPGSNKVRYNTDYYGREVQGDDYKWCVVFLWWVFNITGERMAFYGGGKTASCGTLLRWYRERGLTVPVSEARPGDIVILNFHGTQDTEHCGLVLSVNSTDSSYVNTIEGNTTPGYEGSQDNGGCVALKHRNLRQIVGVCRPQYKPEEPVQEPEREEDTMEKRYQTLADVPGWADATVRKLIRKGLLRGTGDGLDLSHDMLRILVILDRAGVFE